MNDFIKLTSQLLDAYETIFSDKSLTPTWAVHKRNYPSELVRPTIPFVGKQYPDQKIKILVYASAENLADYWKGNDKHWTGDWLDDDIRAANRHRYCFDNPNMQEERTLPYVHCSPMQDGGLLIAVMYMASKLRTDEIAEPYAFYETIAFGNYGKFSIETELQRTIRNNPDFSYDDKFRLKKELPRCNIDYATMVDYLKKSSDYIKAELDILKPDYIIMPNMEDNGFIDSVKGNAKIIRICQMNATVVNNMAPNKRNHYKSKYYQFDIDKLTPAVKTAYTSIRGINLENYRYVFDYLDKVLESKLTNKK